MEIQITLKDVDMEGGKGCELTVKIDGESPEDGTMLRDIPSTAFLIAIQHLHDTGDYMNIAGAVLQKIHESRTNEEKESDNANEG